MDNFQWFRRLSRFNRRDVIMTLDFSSFDSTVPAFLIRDAFKILRNLFQLDDREEKYWDFIVDYFINTPIMMYGTVRQKHRGVPSGSCFTNIIDTLCNMIICYYTASLFEFSISDDSNWMGDDAYVVIVSHRIGSKISCSSDFQIGSSHFGMVCNPDKCDFNFASGDLDGKIGSYLSRDVHIYYPQLRFKTIKFLGQLLIPEEEDKDPSMTLDRIIGLTYAYGFEASAYKMLSACYQHVVNLYPCKPSFNPRIIARMNRFTNHSFTHEEWVFPTYKDIHFRYYGYS
jgi:hypothetical protein